MNTYRQGFDGKWPGEPKGIDPSTHPKQDTADVAGTMMEPGDPMDAHDTFRDLKSSTDPAADTEVKPSAGAADMMHRTGGQQELLGRVKDAVKGDTSMSVTSSEAGKIQDAESAATDTSGSGILGSIKSAFGGTGGSS